MRAPELVSHSGFKALGLSARTSNDVELDHKRARLPTIWQRFYDEAWPARLGANAYNGRVVGVYNDYENGARGQFTVTAAVQIVRTDTARDGLDLVSVTPGEYVRFQAYGMGPEAVIAAWAEVWEFFSRTEHPLARGYERAFTADFEHYGNPEAVSIYVAVKRKLGVQSVQGVQAR